MERQDNLQRRDERIERRSRDEDNSFPMGVGGIVGGLALVGVVALVIFALPDIKRYIKISRM